MLMKTKAEVLIDQLEEIARNQDEMTDETPYDIGDVVNLIEDGVEYIGIIEDEDKMVYQIRVYAEAGNELEPTDKIFFREADEIQLHEQADSVDDNPETRSINNDDEEEEKSIIEGQYVQWETQSVGVVCGQVQELKDTTATVEVFAKVGDMHEPTGVTVEIEKDSLSKSEFEVKTLPYRILTKMDEVEIMVEDNIGRFKGIGSQYGQVDLGGDTVAKGAYTQTLNHKGGKIKLLFDHGYKTKDIAGIANLTDSDKGLMVDAEMPLDAQDVKDAFIKIKFLIERGEDVGLSIGYDPIKVASNADGTRTLKEIALHEMSITPFPMDTGAKILYAKSKRIAYKAMQSSWQTIKSDAPLGNQGD